MTTQADVNSIQIREFREADRDAVLRLAPRLIEGMAEWRNRDGCFAAFEQWVNAGMERPPDQGALLVATDHLEQVVGFIGFERKVHFSGEAGVYIGELVVDDRFEGRGIGRALVQSAEEWTQQQGYRTMTLDTGTANHAARQFYDRLGFQEESIALTKVLT